MHASTSDFSMVHLSRQSAEYISFLGGSHTVKNHGIPDSTIQDALLPRMKDFFELPIEEKMLV